MSNGIFDGSDDILDDDSDDTDFHLPLDDTGLPPFNPDTDFESEQPDDINLDSFGSGSGLLDLSLQADDTSLGGILDEIYRS